MAIVSRSRIMAVAAALVLFLDGGNFHEAEAFVLPSGLATQRPIMLPNSEDQDHKREWTLLNSFKFIKGETSYGDVSEGASYSGMLGNGGSIGFGGGMAGGNSLSRRRRQNNAMWWSRFSQNTPTTLLAAGSLESWPVMEADDIQVLVKKGDDEDHLKKNDGSYGSTKSVKATLERWESDIALEVVGRDGYPMRGNQMQPGYNSGNENSRCTQSIKFDVTNGDLYPFSGTISVPPPLTVEDSMGNKQTVMMVLNNPDDENDQGFVQQQQYDEYGNELPPSKPSSVEAKLEPLYKSPDQKYAEAQQQQQLQYDEWGNELYNPQQQQMDQKTTIPSNGYQSFELDATDPSSGKIKIDLEREEGGGGFGFGGGGNSASEARVEIYHGFKDQYGNPYNNNFGDEEEDRRISFEVSTMHPTFSSVVDTMPASMLAKHSLPSANDLSFVQPYLEVRIVNTGGAALKAGVKNFLPQYRPQSQKQQSKQRYEKQKYEQRFSTSRALNSGSTVKADDPFLLVDSAQSTTSSRRMNNNIGQQEKTYVRASSSNSYSGRSDNTRINEMWSTGARSNNGYNSNGYYEDQGMARPSQDGYSRSFGNYGMKANNPEDLGGSFFFGDDTMRYSNRVMASQRNRPYDSYGNDYYGNDYYGNDAIDTIATSKSGSSGLIANNDFTKANGSKTSAIVPGSLTTGNYRGSLQSFGGNSGGASGMPQPYQGRSQMFQAEAYNGGGSMFQGRSQNNGFGNVGFNNGMQEQSFGNSNGSTMFQGRSQNNGIGNNGFNNGMQEQSFGNNGGNSMFQGRSQNNGFGNNGMQEQSFGNNGFNRGSNQKSGGGFQQAFSQLTSPRKTRTVQGQRSSGDQRRYNSAFSGNGNVIGNGVISGRSPTDSTTVGSENRMMNNRNLGGANNGFQQPRLAPRNYDNNDQFGNAQSQSFQSSFTPEASNNFGGGNPMGNSFGQGNMGSMNRQAQSSDSFSRGNNNNQRGGGLLNKMFGGNNNSNDNQRQNGMNNNRFGGNNSNNNSNNSFGSSNNGGSPFGNMGIPPQTRGNSKNPFATLNGESTQEQNNGFSNNNSFGNNNNGFGNGGGGAPQRPLSPNPETRKNPFAGLNGNSNQQKNPFANLDGSQNNRGFGGSSTAMRSSNNQDYGQNENPVVSFAKNLFGKQ